MKLLIVEGNPQSIWQTRQDIGATPYHQRFKSMLAYLGYGQVIDTAHPADIDEALPSVESIRTYDGILITGGSLNVYSDIPMVTRQLEFMDTLFASSVPIYGSCWGMQMASVVAGGKVELSPNGREFGVSEVISLNEKGKSSPYFKDKPTQFNALCIHEDEITQAAENTEVLASNAHSPIQALTLHYKKSSFFGVQYHPEFIAKDILLIAQALAPKILGKNNNPPENITDFKLLFEKILPISVRDYAIHTIEVKNWLSIVKSGC